MHNGEQTIARAIRSCLDQTYHNFEVIVVDNASTDNTAQAVRGVQDKRVGSVYTPTAGRSHARNLGLSLSTGEFILFLDADDELAPQAMASFNRALERHPQCDAVQCATSYILPDGGVRIVRPFCPTQHYYSKLHVRNTVPINSMAIARELCGTFPEDTEFCEDWLFWLRSLRTATIHVLQETNAIVHIHRENTSQDKQAMKCNEIPVYLEFLADHLPLSFSIRRAAAMAIALATYAHAGKIQRVENSLARHQGCAMIVRTLRRYRWLGDPFRSYIRRRYGF